MNLHHLLSRLPHEQLQQLADVFGVGARTPSKRNLLDAIGARYRDEEFISLMVEELSPDCRGFLRALVYFTDAEPEILTIPISLTEGWSRRKPFSEILQTLFDDGFLFQDHSNKTEGVILPREIRSLLLSIFQEEVPPLVPVSFMDSVHPHRRIPVLEGLFHLLSLLNRRKNPLTRNGTMHHRIYELWQERLVSESTHQTWFQFLLKFALVQGLVQKQDNTYRISSPAADWFQREEMDLAQALWGFYREKEIFIDPDFQRVIILLLNAAEAVRSSTANPVFLFRDLAGAFSREVQRSDVSADVLVQEYFQSLVFLDLVELNQSQPEWTFHFTVLGKRIFFALGVASDRKSSPPEPCVIQPNFDLLVPPSVGYGQLWQIDQIAEFHHRDILTQYHITRAGILHAMRRGWCTDPLLAFFETITDGKIPQNVRYSMEEWCGRYGQVTLQRVVLVRCISRELADELSHIPEILELLGERISDHHYAVPESHARALFQTLQEKGYEPARFKFKTEKNDPQ